MARRRSSTGGLQQEVARNEQFTGVAHPLLDDMEEHHPDTPLRDDSAARGGRRP